MIRNKLLFVTLALTAIILAGCRGKDTTSLPADGNSSTAQTGTCRIHGTAPESLNGVRVFLVPLYGPKTAEYVDSMEIADGHFEFTKDTTMMAKILVDYHHRMGVEQLLVVTEPGNLNVTLGNVSHGGGTPQNDSLEIWKQATEIHNAELAAFRRAGRDIQADSVHSVYKTLTRRMARNMEGTMLGTFLSELYPQNEESVE